MEPKTTQTQDSISQEETNHNVATDLAHLENLIKNYLDRIDLHQEKLNKIKEMVDDTLNNDPDYSEAAKLAKEATQKKTVAKKVVLDQPENARLFEEYKDAVAQRKEMKDNLSLHLQNYASISGTRQFEDNSGETREIIYLAKVVKRSNKFRT